jgi:hypothetical protein
VVALSRINAALSASTTISGPGTYGVTTAGVTISLANWTNWSDLSSVKVKDLTGVSNPNITVQAFPGGGGTIDGQPSIVISQAFESLSFAPFLNGNQWVIE